MLERERGVYFLVVLGGVLKKGTRNDREGNCIGQEKEQKWKGPSCPLQEKYN